MQSGGGGFLVVVVVGLSRGGVGFPLFVLTRVGFGCQEMFDRGEYCDDVKIVDGTTRAKISPTLFEA